ncbi:MAG: hypothetical protein DA407_07545 [Bacteroidetes bacterium]|nr:MAG: hypothetical protein DA407_07545 [Bacteroidota bacterium]
MSDFFNELKRRNVIKSAIAYVVVAWVLLQVLSIVLPNVDAPEWVMKTIMLMMVIGFPVWLFFSWVFEVTPEGLKKTKQVTADQSVNETTNKRLNILILVGLVLAIAVSFFNKSSVNSNSKDLVILENSIAVLYFDDISSGGDTEWFCDGVTEDILTNLSKIKELTVISKTSTKRYKNTDKSIPEIAAELGVSYIVEGSVRRHENQVIITAQLIDANDKHLWAENYNDNFKEVFKIQQDVSQKIATQLRIAISPEVEKEINKLPTNNLEAYNLVLRGRNFAEKPSEENYASSLNLYKEAIALDPNYADAYAELAYVTLLNMYLKGDTSLNEQFIVEATKQNEIALKLDPNSVRANSTKGLIMTESYDEKTRLQSEKYFEKALSLNPNDAVSHLEFSIFYDMIKKDNEKSLYHARKAFELNPFSADTFMSFSTQLLENNRSDEAKKVFNSNRDKFPDDFTKILITQMADTEATSILKNNGDYNKSIEVFNDAISKYPLNADLLIRIAIFYDCYLNDDINNVNYYKKAIDVDSTTNYIITGYYNALLENKQFKEAKEFGQSSIYLDTATKEQKLQQQFMYYYHQNKNNEALEILKDSVFANDINSKLWLYSQMGNKEKIYEILKANKANTTQKAYAFANLKERDSLYYYLNKDDVNALNVNSRREFDRYRKEPRYIEFMKKNYLPIIDGINN